MGFAKVPIKDRLNRSILEQHGLVCRRARDGDAVINIEQAHEHHSPTGMEFGYLGSGPADLALNVLAALIPIRTTHARAARSRATGTYRGVRDDCEPSSNEADRPPSSFQQPANPPLSNRVTTSTTHPLARARDATRV